LINKMLQDLESRRATLEGAVGAAPQLRPLPPQRAALPRVALLSAAAVVVCAGIGLGWYAITQEVSPTSAAVSRPPAAAAPPAPTPAPPRPQPAPLAAPAAAQEQVPAAAPEQVPAAQTASSPPVEAAPSPSSTPSVVRDETAGTRQRQEREIGLKVATSLSSRAQTQSVGEHSPSVAAQSPPVVADDVRIEKKMRTPTPRARAENEYRRALALVNQGRIQEAAVALRAALSEDRGHLGARLALFGLLVEQQRLEEAQSLLQEALADDPLQPQLASRLARLQLERGDARGAAQTLGKAAAAAANDAEFRALHAAVLQRLTLHKEAVAEYRAALRLVPWAGVWWMGLGISLEAEGETAEARAAFERARASGALSAELDRFVEKKLRQLQ
jgi:MSHA biogenesis protein MshN